MCRLLHCWQNPGLLTDTYLTSRIFKVLYVSNPNSNLHRKWLFYTFLFVSALVFFMTMRSLWYSQIFHLFYHICKAKMRFQSPWKCFCRDLVCCNMEINPNALCLWICSRTSQRGGNVFHHFVIPWQWSNIVLKVHNKSEDVCVKVLRLQVLFNICAISHMQISHFTNKK